MFTCRLLWDKFTKKASQFKPALELDPGFPSKVPYGSSDLKQWAEKNNNRNWKRIPQYARWMREPVTNMFFQTQDPFKGHTQQIIARLLDISLFETSPANTTPTGPMGLSNFGSNDGTGFISGRVVDNNNFVVMNAAGTAPAKITFLGGSGTYFLAPFEDAIPNSTEKALCFPVLILPNAQDNDSGLGKKFIYITFQFPYRLYNNAPAADNSTYLLRTNQYHDLVPLITDILMDQSLGANDKSQIFNNIMAMLKNALNTTNMGALELKYHSIINNWLTAKFVMPSAVPAAGSPNPTYPCPGNNPLERFVDVSWDFPSVAGQTPVYNWMPRSDINGYTLQIQLTNAYYGYAPSFTSASVGANAPVFVVGNPDNLNTPLGWYTATTSNPDLAPIVVKNATGQELFRGKPVVYNTVSDHMMFSVDESTSTAVLTVTDRQIVIQKTQTDSPMVYPFYLTRSMSTLFRTKAIFWDSNKGMAGNLTLSNLQSISSMNTPMTQALVLALADSVATSCIPQYSTSQNTQGPFSYYSPLFSTTYKASIFDLFRSLMNQQSPTMTTTIGPNSIGIQEAGSTSILNPSGALDTNGKPANAPKAEPMTGNSTADVMSAGLTVQLGVTQSSDAKINLNTFNASAGSSGANPAVAASAVFTTNGFNGPSLASNPYAVSRLRAVAAASGPSKNKDIARAVVARTARRNLA